MISLKINNATDRNNVVIALVNSGYTVRVSNKYHKYQFLEKDYFVDILEFPNLPKYSDDTEE